VASSAARIHVGRITSVASARRDLSLSAMWVAAALLVPVIALLHAPLSMIDLAYQVRAGEIMLRTHSVLSSDPFSFAATRWFDQQWLAQVSLAVVFSAAGWVGLAILRATLAATIAGQVLMTCRARGLETKRAALLTIGALVVAYPGMTLRPQLFALVLFSLTGLLLARRVEHPGWLWLIPALTALWANIHGSFFMAPLLIGLVVVADPLRRSSVRRLSLVLGATLLAPAANPHGFAVWRYVVALSTNSEVTDRVQEWQRTTLHWGSGVVFFLSVAAVAFLLVRRRSAVDVGMVATLAVFFLIGLSSLRGVHWWGLAAAPAIAPLLAGGTVRERRCVANSAFVSAMVALAVGLLLPWVIHPSSLFDDAPTDGVNAVRAAWQRGDRVFGAQVWGSWLDASLPRRSVFVDSRIEVFPREVWNDYDVVSDGEPGWQAILDRWRITFVVAENTQQRGLLRVIGRSGEWRLLFRDRTGAVYARA
jgi:hypothetical protein